LLDELPEDGHQHEDTEHLVLKTLLRVGCIEQRETDEKSRQDAETCLGVDVRWSAPVLLENTNRNLAKLLSERRSELTVSRLILALLS
jgi:hypothetical protein